MPGWLYAGIVVVFLLASVLYVRTTQKGRIVDRLPLAADEDVLLEEEGLKVHHSFRRTAVFGGGTQTHRVRGVLTDRRLLLVTGRPEGKHKFVILMVLDYTAPAEPVPDRGYAAYKRKFHLENGYPTYHVSAADVRLETEKDDGRLRIDVPFPEAGKSWGRAPSVTLFTKRAAEYLEAITRRSATTVY